MGHKVLVGGTSYEIKSGKTLIDGTAYSITKGRTMIGGTGYDVSFSSASPVFEDNSWATIKEESLAGNAPVLWNIGDKKPIALSTGQVVSAVIADFGHDLDANGNTIGVTLALEDCLNTLYPMNNTDTNVGGWASCALRATLNSTIFAQLPTELQSAITSAVKKASAGGQSSTIINSTDKLWLFSEVEVSGATANSFAGEGMQYSIFTDNASRIKKVNGSASPWYLRSPYAPDSLRFCFVTAVGAPGATLYSRGIAFGFCI